MIYLRGDADKPLGGLYLRSQDSKAPTSGAVTGTMAATATPATASMSGAFSDGSAPTRIINHTNFDPASRTLGEIQAAAALDIYLEHASTGEDIVGDSDVDSSTGTNFNDSQTCGMALLYAADNRFLMSRETFDGSNDYTWFASNNGLQSNMRGNPTPATKISQFFGMSASMRAALDVAFFKFCWIDVWDGSGYNGTTTGYISDGEATANSIISQTVSMESANPGLVVPLVTMPLQADESYAQRQIFNDTMRAWAETNNHWLWDIADIESHSPGGVITLDGNSREVTYSTYAYVDGGHLSLTGAERLARSFWQLLIAISQDLPAIPITGTMGATASPATAAMSGAHTTPAFTGTLGATAAPATAAMSGAYSLPGVSGTLGATATPATAAMSGAHTAPTGITGTLGATATPATAAMSGEHTAPVIISGTLGATATPATAAMSGTFAEQVVRQVSSALTLQPLELSATLDFSFGDSIMIQSALSLQGLRVESTLLFREIYIPVYRRGRMDVMERCMSNSKLTLWGRNGAIANTGAFEELNEYSQAMNWAVQWPTAAKLDISSASAADTGVAVTAAATFAISKYATVLSPNHRIVTGTGVILTTTGALPTGITAGTTYYARAIDANSFTLHDSAAHATANTDQIVITSTTQSGVHTLTILKGEVTVNIDQSLGTATVTIAAPGVVTKAAHGLTTGEGVALTTTGALPTGITAGITYYARVLSANTFTLHASEAHALANISPITTTGTQSGTHTLTVPTRPSIVNLTSHNIGTGGAIVLATSGALLTGLAAGTTYYVREFNADSFYLHTTKELALAGTSGIKCSGTQSGTHTLNFIAGPTNIDAASTAIVTQATHGLATRSEVFFTTTGALPVGVVSGRKYYARVIDTNTFYLHPTIEDAIAGLNPVSISGTQSGTHTMSERATGANKILVWGLDGNGDLQSEEVTLAGQTIAETTKTFLRVFGAEVTACGTGGVNAGNIHIVRDGTGGTYTAGVPGTLTSAAVQVPAGKGCAGSGMVTIPRGYRGRLVFLALTNRAQVASLRLLTQPIANPLDNSAHLDLELELSATQSVVLGASDLASVGMEWQPMTDIRAQALAGAAGGIASIHAVVQLLKA